MNEPADPVSAPATGSAAPDKLRAARQRSLRGISRHPWLIAFGALALAIVVLVLLWDWNWFKGAVERQAEQRTGHSHP